MTDTPEIVVVRGASKDDLEKEKLRLEIRNLDRPWYQRPEYIGLPISMLAVVATIVATIISANLDAKKATLEQQVKQLNDRKRQLELDVEKYQKTVTRLSDEQARLQNITNDLHHRIETLTTFYKDIFVNNIEMSLFSIKDGIRFPEDDIYPGNRICRGSWTLDEARKTRGYIESNFNGLPNENSGNVALAGIFPVPDPAELGEKIISKAGAEKLALLSRRVRDELIAGKFDEIDKLRERYGIRRDFDKENLKRPYYVGEQDKEAICNSDHPLYARFTREDFERIKAFLNQLIHTRFAMEDFLDTFSDAVAAEIRSLSPEDILGPEFKG